jgi:hypothetical protein
MAAGTFFSLDCILSNEGGEGSNAVMERSDFVLNLVSVWLAANMAVVGYLAFLYAANRISELTRSRMSSHASGGERQDGSVLFIDRTQSLHSHRGF